MFTARPYIGFARPLPGLTQPTCATSGKTFRAGKIFRAWGILRMAALLGCLALGLPGTSSAQALGTMQVAARVVPALVGWTGLAEARAAARSAAARQAGRAFIRRARLVHATAQIQPSSRPAGGRRLLIVTLQHPHN
jgi:hypothetical protein